MDYLLCACTQISSEACKGEGGLGREAGANGNTH